MRVGVPGEAEIEPPTVVEPEEIAEPPCESYVTVNAAAVTVKVNVWFAVDVALVAVIV